MQPETKLRDLRTDERAGLPSNRVYVALAALGLLLLASAAFTSERVASPSQRISTDAKAVKTLPYVRQGFEPLTSSER
jgi:hypothetical protein